MLMDILLGAYTRTHALQLRTMSKRQADSDSWLCVVDDLPVDVWLYVLAFVGAITASLEGFEHLYTCTRLLCMEPTAFMNGVVPYLAALPDDIVATDRLLARCSRLRCLRLGHIDDDDEETIKCVRLMLNLESLSLNGGTMRLCKLVCLPKLRYLSIGRDYVGVDNEGLQQLTGLTSLVILPARRNYVKGMGLYDNGIVGLTNLCKLECGASVSDTALQGLEKLHTLVVRGSAIKGESLSSLLCLTDLTLAGCAFVSTTVIASLTDLRRLSLEQYPRHPNFVLDELASLRKLQFLAVHAKRPDTVQTFISTHWPDNSLESHIYV